MAAIVSLAFCSARSLVVDLSNRKLCSSSHYYDGSLLMGRVSSRGRGNPCWTPATAGMSSGVKDRRRQTFVEPRRLLLTEDGDESTSGRTEGKDQSGFFSTLYYLTLSTSQDDKSDLSEPSAGICFSLIGENGEAVLKRIPPIEEGSTSSFLTRFQAGSVDNDVCVGSDLGRLAALWVAPGAGTWRLAQARVVTLQWTQKFNKIDSLTRRNLGSLLTSMSEILSSSETTQDWKGYVYRFESKEALLGAGDDSLAAELRPSTVQEYTDPAALHEALLGAPIKSRRPLSSTLPKKEIARLRELSMKEYEELKLQFLGISGLLVGVGTFIFAVLGQDMLTESFAAGGLGGFLYLLVLQSYVDQLPGPDTSASDLTTGGQGSGESEKGSPTRLIGTAKLPVSLALVAGIVVLVGRLSHGGAVTALTPQMLLAGVGGFLTSRVAVIIASLKSKSSDGQ